MCVDGHYNLKPRVPAEQLIMIRHKNHQEKQRERAGVPAAARLAPDMHHTANRQRGVTQCHSKSGGLVWDTKNHQGGCHHSIRFHCRQPAASKASTTCTLRGVGAHEGKGTTAKEGSKGQIEGNHIINVWVKRAAQAMEAGGSRWHAKHCRTDSPSKHIEQQSPRTEPGATLHSYNNVPINSKAW